MLKGLLLFALVALLAAAGAWLADNPGHVALDWQGYHIETSAAVLLVLVGMVAGLAAVLYRFWRALVQGPGALAGVWRDRARRRGYQALSKGMVAVAAGDADEAAKQAKKADSLLSDPPLTLLLSAQSAQMNGDEDAARGYFEEMAAKADTEFLGVRGLLGQALAKGDEAEALVLARRAWSLQPNSVWVGEQLFTLLAHAEKWAEAEAVMDGARRRKMLEPGKAERRQWIVRHQAARAASTPNDALRRAKKVYDANPDFIPGALALAKLWLLEGNKRKALKVIEKTWGLMPHPDLLAPYWQAKGADDTLARLRAAEALAKQNPDHKESRLVLAEQAMEARLWGEARRYLAVLTEDAATKDSRRVCRMMAALEDGEHQNAAAARDWLMRASLADPDPAWVCSACGHVAPAWTASCGHCDGFDTLAWTVPPHAHLLPADETLQRDVLLPSPEKTDLIDAPER